MKNLPIALRMLRRNAHAGEARVLAAALFVAVARCGGQSFGIWLAPGRVRLFELPAEPVEVLR